MIMIIALLIPVILLGIVIAIFWTEIMVFISPNNYNRIFMKEHDGNIRFWYQKKTKDLTFEFRNGIYYLSYAKEVLERMKNDEE